MLKPCQDVEHLHLATAWTDRKHISILNRFSGLKEFRLDQHYPSGPAGPMLRNVLSELCKLQQLRVVDLRSPYCTLYDEDGEEFFFDGWAKLIPQVTVVRLSFGWFADALVGTDPRDNIHFELLSDRDRLDKAVLELRQLKASRSSDSRTAADQPECDKVKSTVACVEQLQMFFDTQRLRGRLEGRHVTIIDYRSRGRLMGKQWLAEDFTEWRGEHFEKTVRSTVDEIGRAHV